MGHFHLFQYPLYFVFLFCPSLFCILHPWATFEGLGVFSTLVSIHFFSRCCQISVIRVRGLPHGNGCCVGFKDLGLKSSLLCHSEGLGVVPKSLEGQDQCCWRGRCTAEEAPKGLSEASSIRREASAYALGAACPPLFPFSLFV